MGNCGQYFKDDLGNSVDVNFKKQNVLMESSECAICYDSLSIKVCMIFKGINI